MEGVDTGVFKVGLVMVAHLLILSPSLVSHPLISQSHPDLSPRAGARHARQWSWTHVLQQTEGTGRIAENGRGSSEGHNLGVKKQPLLGSWLGPHDTEGPV